MRTEKRDLNPGGASIPFFGRFPAECKIRYDVVLNHLGQGIVVDYGCGYGFGAYLIATRHTRLTLGLDIDRRAIRFAKSHYKLPNLRFELLNEVRLPVADSSVCLISFFEVLEHLFENQTNEFFAETRRTLMPGGVIIGSTPNTSVRSPHDFVYHIHEYTAAELKRLASVNGFHIQVLGRGNPAPASGLINSLVDRLPRTLKHLYALKVAQSLMLSIHKESEGPHDYPGNLPVDESPELYFFMRRNS